MTHGHSLDTLSAGDFRDTLGERFQMAAWSPGGESAQGAQGESARGGSGVCVDVELAEVTEQGGGPAHSFRIPFSVLFHGPLQPVLPQGMYRLEHERLGALDLFIVPIGPDEPAAPGERPTAMRYEAVFG